MKKILLSLTIIICTTAISLGFYGNLNATKSSDLLTQNIDALSERGGKTGAFYDMYKGGEWIGMCCGPGDVRDCGEEPSIPKCGLGGNG